VHGAARALGNLLGDVVIGNRKIPVRGKISSRSSGQGFRVLRVRVQGFRVSGFQGFTSRVSGCQGFRVSGFYE